MSQAVKGVKLARYDLVPPEATWAEALVFGWGCEKYAERNWEGGYDWGKSIAALERHLQLFKAGQDLDDESGLPHMAHIRWHTAVLLAFAARNIGEDDRTKMAVSDSMQAPTLNQNEIDLAREPGVVLGYNPDA